MAEETTLIVVSRDETTGKAGGGGTGVVPPSSVPGRFPPAGGDVPPTVPPVKVPTTSPKAPVPPAVPPAGGPSIGGVPVVAEVSPLLAGIAGKLAGPISAVVEGAKTLKRAFDIVSEGLKKVEDSLAPFSPDIAVARAEVNIEKIVGRISRAQEFGPQIAELVKTRGRVEEQIEDIKTRFLIKFLPLIEGVLTGVGEIVNLLGGIPEAAEEARQEVITRIATTGSGILELLGLLDDGTTKTLQEMRKIARNTEPENTAAFQEDIFKFLTGRKRPGPPVGQPEPAPQATLPTAERIAFNIVGRFNPF